jgi:hypothetical protein
MAKKLFTFETRAESHTKLQELYAAGYPHFTECREDTGVVPAEFTIWDGPDGDQRAGQVPAEPAQPAAPVLDEAFAKLVAQQLAAILTATKPEG